MLIRGGPHCLMSTPKCLIRRKMKFQVHPELQKSRKERSRFKMRKTYTRSLVMKSPNILAPLASASSYQSINSVTSCNKPSNHQPKLTQQTNANTASRNLTCTRHGSKNTVLDNLSAEAEPVSPYIDSFDRF